MFSAITISLRIANWLNWFFGALLMVTLSAILGDWAGLGTMVFTRIEPASTHNAIRGYLFAMVVMMPPIMVAVHWILTRLAALVRDAAVGHALTDANAARLRAIAWATANVNQLMFVTSRRDGIEEAGRNVVMAYEGHRAS